MRLFQFTFWKNANHEFLPNNYPVNCVAYTGTHDNDTNIIWHKKLPKHEPRFCNACLGGHTKDIALEMIRTIGRTNAAIAIAPMQDFLRLGGWARMNLPATTKVNWLWHIRSDALNARLINWIKELNITYGRSADRNNGPQGTIFQPKITLSADCLQ